MATQEETKGMNLPRRLCPVRLYRFRQIHRGYLPSMQPDLLAMQQVQFYDQRHQAPGRVSQLSPEMRVSEYHLLHAGMWRPRPY